MSKKEIKIKMGGGGWLENTTELERIHQLIKQLIMNVDDDFI